MRVSLVRFRPWPPPFAHVRQRTRELWLERRRLPHRGALYESARTPPLMEQTDFDAHASPAFCRVASVNTSCSSASPSVRSYYTRTVRIFGIDEIGPEIDLA